MKKKFNRKSENHSQIEPKKKNYSIINQVKFDHATGQPLNHFTCESI